MWNRNTTLIATLAVLLLVVAGVVIALVVSGRDEGLREPTTVGVVPRGGGPQGGTGVTTPPERREQPQPPQRGAHPRQEQRAAQTQGEQEQAPACVVPERESSQAPGENATAAAQLKAIEAGNYDMPAMVQFESDTCPVCKNMEPTVDRIRQQYQDRAKVLLLNVADNPDAARKYNVEAVPVQLFFDKSGKQVERHEGGMSRSQIQAQFREIGLK